MPRSPILKENHSIKSARAGVKKKSIFFIPWGGYGDVLLATATIKKLRDTYPEVRIYCNDQEKTTEILQHNPLIDRFIPFPHHLFTEESYRQATNNSDADPMIFYPSYGYLKPSLNVPQRHAINVIGDMVGVKAEHADMRVDFSEAEFDFARQFKKEITRPYILLQITPRSHPGKAWSNDRWVDVVRFLNSHGKAAVQVGCSDEQPIPGAVNFLGKTTILQALALLSEAVCFLGIDSVFQHAAYALGIPALVLFGASTPVVWGYPCHVNFYKGLPCQPCADDPQRQCPEFQCMCRISIQEVIDAIREFL
jgi:ADP-heptose:LPS heptosyltransferase